MSSDANQLSHAVIHGLDELIRNAPDEPEIPSTQDPPRKVFEKTWMPARYRPEWERPNDKQWLGRFEKASRIVSAGGILGLVGARGTGKTRIAAELMRDHAPKSGRYLTAMALFLRLRGSYRKGAIDSEEEIVDELASSKFLVIDEIQERGETEWEDRILTHLIDRRYGNMRPTLIIANLTPDKLGDQLGPSINDRMRECGGVIEVTGTSFRKR